MRTSKLLAAAAVMIIMSAWGCSGPGNPETRAKDKKAGEQSVSGRKLEKATFAGGCFWCMEPPFKALKGVCSVISGYTGGRTTNPGYEEVSSGRSGHLEAVQVEYDPEAVSYDELLEVFWRQIDPTDAGGSFVDRGPQYTSAVFFHNREQEKKARESLQALNESGLFEKPVATRILPFSEFYPAEDYHQDYRKKNPIRYKLYREGSGRDRFIRNTWQNMPGSVFNKKEEAKKEPGGFVKPSRSQLKDKLTPLQFEVTQNGGTEPPFDNACWDNKAPGLYVDVVSGEPLFASTDKFDSGTGWPSFTRPVSPDAIKTRTDRSHFTARTEVRSRLADSHLGHVFKDGPPPGGLRYCINSAALRFIPLAELKEQGYEEYVELFKPAEPH